MTSVNQPKITFRRDFTGHFSAYVDGVESDHSIINGSLGVSGHGPNMYGICRPNKSPLWVGSLASAKKTLTHWLSKT